MNAPEIAARLYQLLDGESRELEALSFVESPRQIWPSIYDVDGFAAACIGVANLAAASLLSKRSGKKETPCVQMDQLEACAAFKSEGLLAPLGWQIPPLWDVLAGDYLASDRWIRLHANYPHHRWAALLALGLEKPDRAEAEKAVAKWKAEELEQAVVQQNGCAAVMHSRGEWIASPAGVSTRDEKPVSIASTQFAAAAFGAVSGHRPLEGIRVLDVTRVIAGPVCTRFLASLGADVLRIDPPGFEEFPALIPDTTVGKRCAALDLSTTAGQENFERLIKEAHVLALGLRSNAFDRYGFTLDRMRSLNPALIIGLINAYGFSSLWAGRRGFDSLVQMSCGIAEAGMQAKQSPKPFPLPVQALDHGAGFLLASGICRALSGLWENKTASIVRTSLVGVANFLTAGPPGDIRPAVPPASVFDACLMTDQSEWGALRRVQPPGKINGFRGSWIIPAGSLGRHTPHFSI